MMQQKQLEKFIHAFSHWELNSFTNMVAIIDMDALNI